MSVLVLHANLVGGQTYSPAINGDSHTVTLLDDVYFQVGTNIQSLPNGRIQLLAGHSYECFASLHVSWSTQSGWGHWAFFDSNSGAALGKLGVLASGGFSSEWNFGVQP
jgi:hypothetical protein